MKCDMQDMNRHKQKQVIKKRYKLYFFFSSVIFFIYIILSLHWVVRKVRAAKDLNLINKIKNLNLRFNFLSKSARTFQTTQYLILSNKMQMSKYYRCSKYILCSISPFDPLNLVTSTGTAYKYILQKQNHIEKEIIKHIFYIKVFSAINLVQSINV